MGIAAAGLWTPIWVKTPSRSESAKADQVSLTIQVAHLAPRGGAPPGEMSLDLIVGNVGPAVLQRLVHLGAEPGVVCLAVREQFERESAFVCGAG